jgi:hypothetical protein
VEQRIGNQDQVGGVKLELKTIDFDLQVAYEDETFGRYLANAFSGWDHADNPEQRDTVMTVKAMFPVMIGTVDRSHHLEDIARSLATCVEVVILSRGSVVEDGNWIESLHDKGHEAIRHGIFLRVLQIILDNFLDNEFVASGVRFHFIHRRLQGSGIPSASDAYKALRNALFEEYGKIDPKDLAEQFMVEH